MRKFLTLFLFLIIIAANDLYSSCYPQQLSVEECHDSNQKLYSKHFRILYDKSSYSLLAQKIVEIAEYVWQREVEEFGFKAPLHSDEYYIDIYIANSGAYNYGWDEYVTISSYYSGYATEYQNGAPFFIINPDTDIDIIKVTIAHEFFHAIQYAYGLGVVDNDIWSKNIWFLEASAVMMEDEVYDEINDYIHYLPSYLTATYKDLEYFNGDIEYGKVLFAKFLKERYGMEFIKEIFEHYTTDETLLEDMILLFQEPFEKVYHLYSQWIANIKETFEEGQLYLLPKFYSIDDNITIEHYGFALFQDSSTYLYGENPQYIQSDFLGREDIVGSLHNGLILLNPKREKLSSKDFTSLNRYKPLHLFKGWNMVANVSGKDIGLLSLCGEGEIVWIYRQGRYYGYSSNENIENMLKKEGFALEENLLLSGEAAWVYSKREKVIDMPLDTLHPFTDHFNDGWSYVSIASSAFDIEKLQGVKVVWHYDTITKSWQFYGDYNLPLPKIQKIIPMNGYFIYKESQ